MLLSVFCLLFFFNDTATTEIYTLSLHDALPISAGVAQHPQLLVNSLQPVALRRQRSEEPTSELQSHHDLVCRLLLEKKKKKKIKKKKEKKKPKTKNEITTK